MTEMGPRARIPNRPQVRTRIVWSTVLVLILLGAALAYMERAMTVSVLGPEENVSIQVFGLGTVEARIVSKLGFRLGGNLAELAADHGSRVVAGQLLARIENGEQQARTAKAHAQLSSAEAALKVADAAARKSASVLVQRSQNNRRRQTLVARDAISVEASEDAQLNEDIARSDLLVAQSETDAAKARLAEARAQYELEKVVLTQHELRAPYAGIVISRAKELGSVVSAGEALFSLVAPETVWILSYVDEAVAGELSIGLPAQIKLRSLPHRRFSGTVSRIGLESDRANEERRAYIVCGDCPADFFLGEQAEVLITTSVIDKAVFVPEKLLDRFDGRRGNVWTVEDGILNQRTVTVGRRALDGRLELVDGLPPGAAIVSTPFGKFKMGRAARIAPAEAAP